MKKIFDYVVDLLRRALKQTLLFLFSLIVIVMVYALLYPDEVLKPEIVAWSELQDELKLARQYPEIYDSAYIHDAIRRYYNKLVDIEKKGVKEWNTK